MLDMLKLLADIALKVIPGITKDRRNKQLNQIGADLFLIYVYINETLMLGEIIVEKIDYTLTRLRRRIAREGATASIYVDPKLRILINRQQENLIIIQSLLKQYATPLQIIDGQSYRRLLLDEIDKADFLDSLQGILGAPVADPGSYNDFPRALNGSEDPLALIARWGEITGPSREFWTAEMLSAIEAAIEKSQPRTQLAKIQEQLVILRQALTDTFTISEILVTINRKDAYRDFL